MIHIPDLAIGFALGVFVTLLSVVALTARGK
jgi:hypothetical protein